MFKARYLTSAQVNDVYREALARYERIELLAHLNALAAEVEEELPDAVRARAIMERIFTDWVDPHHEP